MQQVCPLCSELFSPNRRRYQAVFCSNRCGRIVASDDKNLPLGIRRAKHAATAAFHPPEFDELDAIDFSELTSQSGTKL